MELNGRECNMENFRSVNKSLTREDILMLSPLQLAYVGDAVYELLVRTYLLDGNKNVNELHRATTKFVKAEGQADSVHKLEDFLTDREIRVVKKGRNTKTNTSPKHANIVDYKYATGFEALLGYLYLREEYDRINEIFEEILERDGVK